MQRPRIPIPSRITPELRQYLEWLERQLGIDRSGTVVVKCSCGGSTGGGGYGGGDGDGGGGAGGGDAPPGGGI